LGSENEWVLKKPPVTTPHQKIHTPEKNIKNHILDQKATLIPNLPLFLSRDGWL
jgi:hypothetical protein